MFWVFWIRSKVGIRSWPVRKSSTRVRFGVAASERRENGENELSRWVLRGLSEMESSVTKMSEESSWE